ncbi:hypothetical protein F4780DRAFT_784232 [Xylariomycetidae sp. FL0641]|nr:hypothetical protein F4780DRAFT_784232 [Xylariomycetidae sp. FL0641]
MPPTQDNARVVLILIILFWLLISPDSSPGLISGPTLVKNRLDRQRYALGILNSTAWGDFAPRQIDDDPELEPKYLNLTGFRAEDKYAWEDLGRFRNRCEEWNHNAVGWPGAQLPVWQNATGVVRGLWDRTSTSIPRNHSSYNLTDISPGISWNGLNAAWDRNITGPEGKMLVRIDDDENAGTEPGKPDRGVLAKSEIQAREVSATLNVEDVEGTGSSWEMRLHGVHWPREGAMLLTTTSEKYAGIFGLPHLVPRPAFYNSSVALLNRTLDKVLAKKEKRAFMDQIDPWTSTVDAPGESWSPTPHCEYLTYIQVHPVSGTAFASQASLLGSQQVLDAIEDIENELRFPQGAPHPFTPRLQMSAVVYSPDCGFFLETKGPPNYPPTEGEHLIGVKQEVFLYSVSTWLLGLAVVIFGQLHLLKMQMRETSTPSTLGRVSLYTGCMMLLADGLTFGGSSAWSLTASSTMLPSLLVTCVSFLSMTVEAFFLLEVYKAQEPEWRRQERERDRQPSRTTTPRPPTMTGRTTPSNATTARPSPRPPSPPIIVPSDQDIDAELLENGVDANNPGLPAPATAGGGTGNARNNRTPLNSLVLRLFLLGICILFLSLAAATWRPSYRAAYFNTLAFLYLSLWTPQIVRNVHRNCRRALSWPFVVGQSVLRLLPIGYFYLLRGNFAFAEPDRSTFAAFMVWVALQLWILAAQSVLGPRFGIPKGWMPEAWEYHPVLRADSNSSVETGLGLPIGLVPAGGNAEDKKENIHVIDCAICRDTLRVPVVPVGVEEGGGVAGVLARRAYMVTPCRHIFHSPCLEGWMRFRLQCPICREELPPL